MIVMILDTEFAYDENRPFSSPGFGRSQAFSRSPTPTRTGEFMMLKFDKTLGSEKEVKCARSTPYEYL